MADNQSNYPIAIPIIDVDHCTGCGRCVAACPPHVLWLESAQANGWGKKRRFYIRPKTVQPVPNVMLLVLLMPLPWFAPKPLIPFLKLYQ